MASRAAADAIESAPTPPAMPHTTYAAVVRCVRNSKSPTAPPTASVPSAEPTPLFLGGLPTVGNHCTLLSGLAAGSVMRAAERSRPPAPRATHFPGAQAPLALTGMGAAIGPKGMTTGPKGITIGPKGMTIGPKGMTIGPNGTAMGMAMPS